MPAVDLALWKSAIAANLDLTTCRIGDVLAAHFVDGAVQISADALADASPVIVDTGTIKKATATLRRAGFLEIVSPPDAEQAGLRYVALLPARAHA